MDKDPETLEEAIEQIKRWRELYCAKLQEISEMNEELYRIRAEARAEREELKKHIAKLEGALQNLQFAESRYRYQHDALGDGHIKTGMAWDSMKKRGDEARAALAEKGD